MRDQNQFDQTNPPDDFLMNTEPAKKHNASATFSHPSPKSDMIRLRDLPFGHPVQVSNTFVKNDLQEVRDIWRGMR